MSRYERERARLVEEYVTAAWKMWQSLSPADWWNDAVTQGASANLTSRYMAFVERMRRLGIAYADIALGLVGATAQGQLPEFEVVRDNTDPWKMMLRPVESYRDASSKEPHLRPSAWENLEADAQRSVDRWLEEANERLVDIIDTDSMIAGTQSHIGTLPRVGHYEIPASHSPGTIQDGHVRLVRGRSRQGVFDSGPYAHSRQLPLHRAPHHRGQRPRFETQRR